MKKFNECMSKKIIEYIKELGLDRFLPNVYIPNYIIEEFEKVCDINGEKK